MIYDLATKEDLQFIYELVQYTIKTIYPKYYLAEVVDFFCAHHSKEAIRKDIAHGYVGVLKVDGEIVATGSFVENHITRVYVLPRHQNKGYGTFIIKQIETQMCKKYDKAYLDASLPAAALYEKLGYHTVKHEKYPVENGVILVYEIMEKELQKKIMIIGSPGSGKSTFARKLRDRLELPLFYLDMIKHKPDRTEISSKEFDAKLREIIDLPEWIIDGNYQRTLEVRMKKADTIILFDLPTEVCLEGAIARIGTKREDLPWIETKETLEDGFRQWIEEFSEKQLPQIYVLLKKYKHKNIVIFKSREEADLYISLL